MNTHPAVPKHSMYSWEPVPNDQGYRTRVVHDHYQVTEWGHPDEPVLTANHGSLTYQRWLELESVRWMEKNLRDSWVRENPEGLIALFSWRKYMAAVVGDDPKS